MVWNLKIRLLHWLMVAFIVINLFIFDEGDLVHYWVGYGSLVIILLRSIIGFRSHSFAAFKKFPLQPLELFNFFKYLFTRNRKNYIGHNPAASYAYIIFWVLVVVLGITGVLLVHAEVFFGDQFLETVHEISADVIIVFIVIHFTGIILDSILHKRKAWMSMITGNKSQ